MDEKRNGDFINAGVQRGLIVAYQQLLLGILALIAVMFFVSVFDAHAQVVVPAAHVDEVSAILYAESASDPDGWLPKLNTYYKNLRRGEDLLSSMRRVSSAYRMKSKQYIKAATKDLNAFERRVYNKITALVEAFRPDPHWPYIHHENFELYRNKEVAIKHLRRAWGDCVDFKNCVQIGKEHYFRRMEDGRQS
jgi:hypothetical protein